jgi:hypothetical protein
VVVAQRLVKDIGFVTRCHDANVGFACVCAFVTGVKLNVQLGVGVVDVAI